MLHQPNTFLPDLRPPKSPKRFFTSPFSPPKSPPPLPPVPSYPASPPPSSSYITYSSRKSHNLSASYSSIETGTAGLGQGAQVVRTPSEALRGVRQPVTPSGRAPPRPSREDLREPALAPRLKTQRSVDDRSRPALRYQASQHSIKTDPYTYPRSTDDDYVDTLLFKGRQSISARKDEPYRYGDSYASKDNSPMMKDYAYGEFPLANRKSMSRRPSEQDVALSAKSSYQSFSFEPLMSPEKMSSHKSPAKSLRRLTAKTSQQLSPEQFSPAPSSAALASDNEEHVIKSCQSIAPLPTAYRIPPTDFDPFSIPPTKDRRSVYTEKTVRPRDARRSTMKPPPKTSLPPIPFSASLVSKTNRVSPTPASQTLITLEFGYSLDDVPKNTNVTLLWEILRRGFGHLVSFVAECLGETLEEEEGKPEMTDGSSGDDSDLDSDYDLDALLRDEYLKSIFVTSPTGPTFSTPVPVPSITTPRKRAATRNQYTQLQAYPSPSSALRSSTEPLNVRRKTRALNVEPEECNGGGTITVLRILLMRDAVPYHLIAARLIDGTFPKLDTNRKKVLEECQWLGMSLLAAEAEGQKNKSMVTKGGSGYI